MIKILALILFSVLMVVYWFCGYKVGRYTERLSELKAHKTVVSK
jgi:hypothetical protein